MRTKRVAAVFAAGIAARVALIAYGAWQDARMQVRYTDVDFDVLTDAAGLVSRGASPYGRATYRYTPLLAALLAPGHLLGVPGLFGKALFCALDVVAATLLGFVGANEGNGGFSAGAAAAWLLNPFVVNISTRGSHEAVVCSLLAGCLWALRSRRVGVLAVCLGAAVHVRLFPVIFALPLLLHIGYSWEKEGTRRWLLFSRKQWTFGLLCFGTFAALSAACFAAYGMDFVQHAYLYHLTRTDHRHNLSPYWLHLYLSSSEGSAGGIGLKLASFVPQVVALASIARRFVCSRRGATFDSVAFGLWAMTVVFVAFNKVYTVQYFAWWLLFAPFAGLTDHGLLRLVRFAALWAAALGLWLQAAYRLEFLGENTTRSVWAAGILLFAASVEPVAELCRLKSAQQHKKEV